MRPCFTGTLLAGLMALAPLPAAAQVTLKMATLVPENSSWFRILKEMGESWNKLSAGRVKVILYPGGRQGDEPDVVRKMRLGSLQGALLTSQGLAEIDRSVYALGIPLGYASAEEMYATLEKMRPGLEAGFETKGFTVVNWADGGWVRFFSRKPIASPEDLRRQKLFTWAGDPKSLEIWKGAGFNAIPAPATELATGLQTGLLDAFITSPQVVLVTRYYEQAPHMTDLKWGLILAGTVLTRDAWNRVPADLRPALLKAAQESGAKFRADMRAAEARDLQALQQAGLKVVAVDARNQALWRQLVDSLHNKIRGEFVPAPAYDEAMKFRDDYRRQAGTARK